MRVDRLNQHRILVVTQTLSMLQSFALAFLALFDPGARVAIAAPGYPAYRNILEAFGIETVTIETADSLVDYVNRFKGDDTILFAEISANSCA